VQRELFPYQYDAYGIFARLWKRMTYGGLSLLESTFPAEQQAEYEQILSDMKSKAANPPG
jgi:hypothetical protein